MSQLPPRTFRLPSFSHLLVVLALSSLAVFAVGCKSAIGVGDPCDPESIPGGGFDRSEVYLETSSVQCRTRVCMVYKTEGLPGDVTYNEEQVYCSCRCDAPEGANTPTCACPSGFTCETILEQGGTGIRGGYCVADMDTSGI